MPNTTCAWCNALIVDKRLPEAKEVSVCAGTNCGQLEMRFRSQFSDEEVAEFYYSKTGIDIREVQKRCDLRKAKLSGVRKNAKK